MILTGENQSTRRKPRLSVTLSAKNILRSLVFFCRNVGTPPPDHTANTRRKPCLSVTLSTKNILRTLVFCRNVGTPPPDHTANTRRKTLSQCHFVHQKHFAYPSFFCRNVGTPPPDHKANTRRKPFLSVTLSTKNILRTIVFCRNVGTPPPDHTANTRRKPLLSVTLSTKNILRTLVFLSKRRYPSSRPHSITSRNVIVLIYTIVITWNDGVKDFESLYLFSHQITLSLLFTCVQ